MMKWQRNTLHELRKLGRYLLTVDAEHRRKKEPGYDQGRFRHDCGTPACASGHYEHKFGSRSVFDRLQGVPTPAGLRSYYGDECIHIAIFGCRGCGNAGAGPNAGKHAGKWILKAVKVLSQKWRA